MVKSRYRLALIYLAGLIWPLPGHVLRWWFLVLCSDKWTDLPSKAVTILDAT